MKWRKKKRKRKRNLWGIQEFRPQFLANAAMNHFSELPHFIEGQQQRDAGAKAANEEPK
jgi:hypothetical protein